MAKSKEVKPEVTIVPVPPKKELVLEGDPEAQLFFAWLAGFIDGEGTLSIARKMPTPKNRSYHIQYRSFLAIPSTDKFVIQHIKDTLDKMSGESFGNISYYQSKNPNAKGAFTFNVTKYKQLAQVVVAIKPYLQIKRFQAELILEFVQSRVATMSTNWHHTGPTFTEREAELCTHLQAINKRGV